MKEIFNHRHWYILLLINLLLFLPQRCTPFTNTLFPRRNIAPTTSAGFSAVPHNVLADIDRIFCLSDLHVDHADNRLWLEENCRSNPILGCRDLLLVAGDVSHRYDRLEDTFLLLKETGCHVLFCPGNHDAWLFETDQSPRDDSSYEKLKRVKQLCRDLGVLVDPTLVSDCPHPAWIVPLQSWYDASLSLPCCEDLCVDFARWPWTDFRSCQWPNHPPNGTQGKIPTGLATYFHEQNLETIDFILERRSQCEAMITMSHFLPNLQCLPDWKDVSSTIFQREEWLDHGAPGTSAKFAKVAGSIGLEKQIRNIHSDMHVFGHSHRPKDFF